MYVLHDKDRCVISLVIGLSTYIVYIFLHDLCKDVYSEEFLITQLATLTISIFINIFSGLHINYRFVRCQFVAF